MAWNLGFLKPLPSKDSVLARIARDVDLPVGYTIGTDFKPATRKPAGEITYWNAWKSRD